MLSNMSEIQSPHNNPSSAVEYTKNHEFIKLVDKKVQRQKNYKLIET